MKLYGSLDNYIEMHRERVGLSQAELSLLIAVEGRASVSRYELGLRSPNLETLLALEVIFEQPIREIFAGVAERVRDSVTDCGRFIGSHSPMRSKRMASGSIGACRLSTS